MKLLIENIWKKISQFIDKMSRYYAANLLVNNTAKTKVQIILNKKNMKKQKYKIEEKI